MHLIGFELDRLEKQLLTLTAVVEESVQLAIKALEDCNYELARKVVDNDAQVNRMEVELEEECLKVLALHQPVANDLRIIVAILKINNDLERIADQAANISERAIAICEIGNGKNRLNIDEMAKKVLDMLEKSLDSLVNADLETARAVLDLDDEVDTIHSQNYQA
ncbi:MAG: phosphate signaling complex protein PhoU, partial [Desulfuromonadales bacterium]